MSLSVLEKPLVTARDGNAVAGFAIAKNQTLVPYKPVTLAEMVVRVDALESAASRATAVLAAATAQRGNDAQNLVTKVTASKGFIPVLAGLGATVAVGAAVVFWPDSANFSPSPRGPWFHNQFNVAYGFCGFLSLLAGAATGAVASVAGACGLNRFAAAEKKRMARDQLRLPHVQSLGVMFDAAKERPLERAALGRVARDALVDLSERQVFKTRDVDALLKGMATEPEEGNAEEVAEAKRHRAFILALRRVERSGGDVDQRVGAFRAAFDGLTPAERHGVAAEVLERLFDEAVPRAKDIPFEAAEPMRAKIMAALEPSDA